ncbi:MAG TPA: SMP-30/gluconolactonase/LRE family protein, partial [Thermoanaerobaculia bacterium]|nr:SMP-30/gluconolactonase/LRE family protein [Thermoanaerobaculia bacterium]
MSVRSASAVRFFFAFIAVLIAVAASAATATNLVPALAPHGARALIVGTGLDAGTMTVTFASSGGSTPATIVSRSATLIEIVVPAAAVTGAVNVDVSGATIASLPFTLAPDTAFVRVTTLVASDEAHDVLKNPAAVAIITASGTAVVADTAHHRVLTVSAAGQVTVLAGSGTPGFADGTGAQAQFKEPAGIAIDETRKIVYVADTSNNAIRAVTYDGRVSTLVGAQAGLKKPLGLAVDSAGTIYVADSGNDSIKAVTPAGAVTTFAGGMLNGFADGAAAQALFKNPGGVAVSSDGVLFVADSDNNRIRKIDHGIVSTIAGTGHGGFVDGSSAMAELKQPAGVAVDDAGNVYVADSGNDAIRKIANGTVTTLAGTGNPGFADGSLASARFKEPSGIAFAGAIFVADSGNDALRIIDPELAISAVYP